MENRELTRIPQFVSLDYRSLKKSFGEQSGIIRDILVFSASQMTRNFFDDVVFSLDDFCKEFGYLKETLRRTDSFFAENPKEKKPYIDDRCFDSVFEYALYKAFTHVLIYNVKSETRSDGSSSFVAKNMILLRKINVTQNSKGKIFYKVELDYEVKDHLLRRYFLTDKTQYRCLSVKRNFKLTGELRNFYLYLGRMISMTKMKSSEKNNTVYISSVDELAKIMNISIQNNRQRKLKVTKNLNKILELIGEDFFSYSFVKGEDQRFAYSVKFVFPKTTLDYFNEELTGVFFSELTKNLDREFFYKVGNVALESGIKSYSDYIIKGRMNATDREKISSLVKEFTFNKDNKDYDVFVMYFSKTFFSTFGIEYDGRFGFLKNRIIGYPPK